MILDNNIHTFLLIKTFQENIVSIYVTAGSPYRDGEWAVYLFSLPDPNLALEVITTRENAFGLYIRKEFTYLTKHVSQAYQYNIRDVV